MDLEGLSLINYFILLLLFMTRLGEGRAAYCRNSVASCRILSKQCRIVSHIVEIVSHRVAYCRNSQKKCQKKQFTLLVNKNKYHNFQKTSFSVKKRPLREDAHTAKYFFQIFVFFQIYFHISYHDIWLFYHDICSTPTWGLTQPPLEHCTAIQVKIL